MLPMALANDAVIRDGACIGDPTEGALVVLAAKGGLDVEETRRTYPRVAEVPFDAEYKLMATFHEMDDDGRQGRAASSRARPTSCWPGRRTISTLRDRRSRWAATTEQVLAENDRLAGEGLRVLAVRRRDFDPASFDPSATCWPSSATYSCSPSSASSTRRARRPRTPSPCARTPASASA